MANYTKTNIYINNDLVFSEEHPRHGWTQHQVALLKYQVALQRCGYALNTCWFEELNEGGWISYERADEVELEEDVKEVQYKDDFINDGFLNHYIKSIKNYKPTSLTVYEWIKPLSIFGIKLNSYILVSDCLGELQVFDHIPSVPEIKSVLYDYEKWPSLEQSLTCLDIPNSLHLPLSSNNSSSNWVINFYYLNDIFWSTKNSHYPQIQYTSCEKEAQRVRFILDKFSTYLTEHCCYIDPANITLEAASKNGPVYRKLSSFDPVMMDDDTVSNMRIIANWLVDAQTGYNAETDHTQNFDFLKCLGFEYDEKNLKLSHELVGEIKTFSPTDEVVYPDIKAAIWERDEFRNALNTLCITNPLHLPCSVYEGVF
jgi:hypothetical protein